MPILRCPRISIPHIFPIGSEWLLSSALWGNDGRLLSGSERSVESSRRDDTLAVVVQLLRLIMTSCGQQAHLEVRKKASVLQTLPRE